jgi:hypothetical protein
MPITIKHKANASASVARLRGSMSDERNFNSALTHPKTIA